MLKYATRRLEVELKKGTYNCNIKYKTFQRKCKIKAFYSKKIH